MIWVSGGTTRDLAALPGHLRALPGHLAALPGHLRVFVASAALTHAFENHGRTGWTADSWPGLWFGLAAWDHWVYIHIMANSGWRHSMWII